MGKADPHPQRQFQCRNQKHNAQPVASEASMAVGAHAAGLLDCHTATLLLHCTHRRVIESAESSVVLSENVVVGGAMDWSPLLSDTSGIVSAHNSNE